MQGSIALAEAEKLGRARRIVNSAQRYMEFAKATLIPAYRWLVCIWWWIALTGLLIGPHQKRLVELGADILPMGVAPDGLNINLDCGATAPKRWPNRS